MTTTIQRRTKTRRQLLGAAAVAMSASVMLAFTPTKAAAFDIGGLIGAAMAVQMGQYHGGYSSGGHTRTRAVSHDSDSSDHGNSGVERDARDPAGATPPSGKSDNHVVAVRGQKTQGPSSSSGGTAQASERDAATGQVASAGKTNDDAPAFNPSR